MESYIYLLNIIELFISLCFLNMLLYHWLYIGLRYHQQIIRSVRCKNSHTQYFKALKSSFRSVFSKLSKQVWLLYLIYEFMLLQKLVRHLDTKLINVLFDFYIIFMRWGCLFSRANILLPRTYLIVLMTFVHTTCVRNNKNERISE